MALEQQSCNIKIDLTNVVGFVQLTITILSALQLVTTVIEEKYVPAIPIQSVLF